MLRLKADTELVLTSLVVHYGAYRATDKNQAERCSPPLAAALLSLIICALQTRLSVTVLRLLEEGAKWPRASNKRSGIRSAFDALTESEIGRTRGREEGREEEEKKKEREKNIKTRRKFSHEYKPPRSTQEFFRRSVPTARRGWV